MAQKFRYGDKNNIHHWTQDTDELLKFRRQWKEELELKQYHHEQQGPGRGSGHASLTGTPDHTPQIQRKNKEEEVSTVSLNSKKFNNHNYSQASLSFLATKCDVQCSSCV